MKVIKWISQKEAEKKEEGIGGMGGWFERGMRWADYYNALYDNLKPYAEAMRQSVIENNLKLTGDQHQNMDGGVPLFEDGKIGSFTMRAWGDIMAAIWSEQENEDYSYMDFYMDYGND